MTFDEVLSRVNDVFVDVLDIEDIMLKYETTAADIEEWDSLSHIELVLEIERQFKVKFTLQEIQGFKNVGHMCDAIVGKLA